MQKGPMLRRQAGVLRDLAKLQWHEEAIRNEMLELAKKCDQLADDRERQFTTPSARRA